MTKDETLKLALDALEGFIPYLPLKDEAQCNRYDKAITALRFVIDAQNMASKSTYKEQLETKDEPVAWEQFYPDMGKPQIAFNTGKVEYVAPQRTWVGLTDEEIQECLQGLPTQTINVYARRIEAKLKEKNT
jgi:hypothetical protein